VRDAQIVEEELMEISMVQDDMVRLERIVAWSAMHPDEVPFALKFLRGRTQGLEHWVRQHQRHE
jgi:hypothetical protein